MSVSPSIALVLVSVLFTVSNKINEQEVDLSKYARVTVSWNEEQNSSFWFRKELAFEEVYLRDIEGLSENAFLAFHSPTRGTQLIAERYLLPRAIVPDLNTFNSHWVGRESNALGLDAEDLLRLGEPRKLLLPTYFDKPPKNEVMHHVEYHSRKRGVWSAFLFLLAAPDEDYAWGIVLKIGRPSLLAGKSPHQTFEESVSDTRKLILDSLIPLAP